jgi:hypothetical protein
MDQDPDIVRRANRELLRGYARESFYGFYRLAFPSLAPEASFSPSPHFRVLVQALEKVATGGIAIRRRRVSSAAIARLSTHLHHGGIMFFQELDWEGARSSPPVPTYDRVCGWIARTIEGGGAQIRLGAHLASVFERAGLSNPTLRLESVIASGPAAIDAIHLVTDLVATQLPNMERMGITNASEVELPTLAQRILTEVGAEGTLVGRAEVAAWTVL